MEEIDYKELLTKYIAHIIDCEGIDFIDHSGEVEFSEQETKALFKLSDDSKRYCY